MIEKKGKFLLKCDYMSCVRLLIPVIQLELANSCDICV